MVESPFKDLDVPYDPMETEETKATTSGERSLSDAEFERLLKAADMFDPLRNVEMRFVILSLGRLGLRVGELAHLRKSWVNWSKEWIEIPAHQPCERGKDGAICGSCRQHAEQMARVNDIDISDTERFFWKPKTAKASREVPFSFSDRVEKVVTRYFEELSTDRFTPSQPTVRRWLDKAAERSGLPNDHLRPHDLRATAANHHAGTGLDVYALKAFMGWSRSETAERYMRDSSERTKKVFEKFHSMD